MHMIYQDREDLAAEVADGEESTANSEDRLIDYTLYDWFTLL